MFLRTEINYAITEKTKMAEKFAIITLVLGDDSKKLTVPKLLEQYVYKYPEHELVALQEIIRALPLKLGAVSLK